MTPNDWGIFAYVFGGPVILFVILSLAEWGDRVRARNQCKREGK